MRFEYRMFGASLAQAIHIERCYSSAFGVRRSAVAVKNQIRRKSKKGNITFFAGNREQVRSSAVFTKAALRIAFGVVHSYIARSVDHGPRSHGCNHGGNRFAAADI